MSQRVSLKLKAALGLDKEGRKKRAERIAASVVHVWQRIAQAELGSAGDDYASAVEVERSSEDGIVVGWPGKGAGGGAGLLLARLKAFGFGPGGVGTSGAVDLRPWLLRSPKAKRSRDGSRYLAVPMGSGRAASSQGVTPQRAGAELLRRRLAQKGHKTLGGRDLKPHHVQQRLGGRGASAAPRSKGGGLRTASDKGSPWIHPGFKPANITAKVARQLGKALRDLI